MTPGSSIPGFFRMDREGRLDAVRRFAGLSDGETEALRLPDGGVTFEMADGMAENAVGVFPLPLGIATNFRVNGRDRLVPMVTEEPSVIAAASKAAKLARPGGGFTATAGEPLSIGQIQILGAPDAGAAAAAVAGHAAEILELANSKSATLRGMGRGAREVSCRELGTDAGPMLIAELVVDVGDAMGANVTNTMCEAVAPLIEGLTGGRALLRILSNYSTRRMVRASATFGAGEIGGGRVADDVVSAYQFAKHDVHRAVTHNKGIMNGIVAVANATGQDSRAIEAAANAYAARSGRYSSLSEWRRDGGGGLVGTLEIPLAVGTVGGITGTHPVARTCRRILGAGSSGELACVIAAAGLAQNLAAMVALATDGIQRGHMRLHARNLAAAAGASPGEAGRVAEQMIREGDISSSRAAEILGRDR